MFSVLTSLPCRAQLCKSDLSEAACPAAACVVYWAPSTPVVLNPVVICTVCWRQQSCQFLRALDCLIIAQTSSEFAAGLCSPVEVKQIRTIFEKTVRNSF